MTGQDIIDQLTEWRAKAAESTDIIYRCLDLDAGEYDMPAPLDHVCASWSPLHLAIRGRGAGVTRLRFDGEGDAAIKSTRGYGPGPSFAISGVSIEPAKQMDGLVIAGVMRGLVADDVQIIGGRRGLVLDRGTNGCSVRSVQIRDTREAGVYADITETGACMLHDVVVQHEGTSDAFAFEIVSERNATTGGEGNIDLIGCKAFGGYRGGFDMRSLERRNLFVLMTHCIADSAQFRGEAVRITNAGNCHFVGCFAHTDGTGASAWSFSGAKFCRMTGCTGYGGNGPDICVRDSRRIVITGGVYDGPVQQLNSDDMSDVVFEHNVGKEGR